MSEHVNQKTWDRILDAAGRIVNSDGRVTVSGAADLDYGLDTLSDELDGIFAAGHAQALAEIRDRGDVIVPFEDLMYVFAAARHLTEPRSISDICKPQLAKWFETHDV